MISRVSAGKVEHSIAMAWQDASPKGNGEAGQGVSGNAERINGAEGIKARGVASKAKALNAEIATHCRHWRLAAKQRQRGAKPRTARKAQAKRSEQRQGQMSTRNMATARPSNTRRAAQW